MVDETHFDRRQLLRASAALAGASLLGAPSLAGATEMPENALLDIARRELERAGRKVWLRDRVGLTDFSRPSFEPRFFLIDMIGGKVKPFLVAHGRGSDPEHDGWLKSFSNEPGSFATSRGAYVTQNWYDGKYGTSLRLSGLDHDNCNASERAIVVHSAWYANPEMIASWGKLGRSEGCFALPEANLMEVMAHLGPGRLLFADKLKAA